MQSELAHHDRAQVKRSRERATYHREAVYRLVDDLKLGHIGFSWKGQLHVIPMTVWRVDDHLYFHTMNKSRMQKLLEAGAEVCISFAECTEWVLAKSAYHHSANYRSAVVYCTGERVTEPDEFDRAFEVCIEQLEAGRWQQVRPPNAQERKATALMKLTIVEGAGKSRSGGPNEEPEDLDLPVWHGTVPVCPFHSQEE
ncbi:pyridoxamine 5'-phosphate oxidase family protein [Halioglobus maricola]|uniref:Pyridoxamine 5'-phosphate oxidase family protein n=1 Tax=Halioglobus maricola TaxID=2601894 RepID=A0A5P9NJJ4_9GAMM|nr:pyridoxamine 5'-phosphate oxidase family protein [Halioglobus maricola]QFU75892.1 pyridoxamine 5'-phosphate oxidase family protein [Halioglobus maricola]